MKNRFAVFFVAWLLTTPVFAVSLPVGEGRMDFWFRPDFTSGDGTRHVLLQAGKPPFDSLMLEVTPEGILRLQMGDAEHVTAARAPVTCWRKGEWVYFLAAWRPQRQLAVYVNGQLLDAMPMAANSGVSGKLSQFPLEFGKEGTSENFNVQTNTDNLFGEAFRSYLSGLPLKEIQIDAEPFGIPTGVRIPQGEEKEMGVLGITPEGRQVRLLFFGEGKHSARPFYEPFDMRSEMRWMSEDENIISVSSGGVAQARKIGGAKVHVQFRDLKASLKLEVIDPNLPDATVTHIERLPRYPADALKDRPTPGDPVEFVAHILNAGKSPFPPTRCVWKIRQDKDTDLEPGSEDPLVLEQEARTEVPIPPGGEMTFKLAWPWKSEPCHISFEIDPDSQIEEICEWNNRQEDLTTAKAAGFSVHRELREAWSKVYGFYGSYSIWDCARVHLRRLNQILKEAICPATSPKGALVRYRADVMGEVESDKDWGQPLSNPGLDGGRPLSHDFGLPAVQSKRYAYGHIHEAGHTILALPDLYGYGVRREFVYVRGPDGNPIKDGPFLPWVGDFERYGRPPMAYAYVSSAGGPEGGCCFYPSDKQSALMHRKTHIGPLMKDCLLYLNESQAGQVHYYRNTRNVDFWHSGRRNIPQMNNKVQVLDIYDRPLPGADLAIYQLVLSDVDEYIPDSAKFKGKTGSDGSWVFPKNTDDQYDDPQTDEFDGLVWLVNPFSTVKSPLPATPSVRCTSGIFLVEVRYRGQVEYKFMDLEQFNVAFYRGDGITGVITLRTNLLPEQEGPFVTSLSNATAQAQFNKQRPNTRPAAAPAKGLQVEPGGKFVLDGSESRDPDGDEIVAYHWFDPQNTLIGHGRTFIVEASTNLGVYKYGLKVSDGILQSDVAPVEVTVAAEAPQETSKLSP